MDAPSASRRKSDGSLRPGGRHALRGIFIGRPDMRRSQSLHLTKGAKYYTQRAPALFFNLYGVKFTVAFDYVSDYHSVYWHRLIMCLINVRVLRFYRLSLFLIFY